MRSCILAKRNAAVSQPALFADFPLPLPTSQNEKLKPINTGLSFGVVVDVTIVGREGSGPRAGCQ